jgi:hypothetical protein
VHVLLADGSGPLYNNRAAERLGAAVTRALRDLEVQIGPVL